VIKINYLYFYRAIVSAREMFLKMTKEKYTIGAFAITGTSHL